MEATLTSEAVSTHCSHPLLFVFLLQEMLDPGQFLEELSSLGILHSWLVDPHHRVHWDWEDSGIWVSTWYHWYWWWSRLTLSWCWGSPSASDQPGPREDDSDQREQHCWCSPDTEQQKYFIFNNENIWSYRLIILIIQILTPASDNLQWIFLVKQFARWSNVSLSQLYRAPLGELLRRWHRQIILIF